MAFITNLGDAHKNRPLKPRYNRVQATPQAVEIAETQTDPVWPGAVLSLDSKGQATLCDGSKAPAGICNTWNREFEPAGSRDASMWVLGADAVFDLTAYDGDEFDIAADWVTACSDIDAGKRVYLKSNEKGQLTVDGNEQTENSVLRLLGMEGQNTIVVAGL